MNYVVTVEKTFRMQFDVFARDDASARGKALEMIEDDFCLSKAEEIDSELKVRCTDIDW